MLPFRFENITLEEFKPRHIAELLEWVPGSNERLLWGGSEYASDDLKGRLKKDLQLMQKSGMRILTRVCFADQTVGHMQLVNIDRRNRCAHMARVILKPELRGRGLGLLMMRATQAFAFKKLKLHRLSLFVYEHNDAALKLYERAGFRREGLLRDRTKAGNNYWSSIAMAMLEDEFKIQDTEC